MGILNLSLSIYHSNVTIIRLFYTNNNNNNNNNNKSLDH